MTSQNYSSRYRFRWLGFCLSLLMLLGVACTPPVPEVRIQPTVTTAIAEVTPTQVAPVATPAQTMPPSTATPTVLLPTPAPAAGSSAASDFSATGALGYLTTLVDTYGIRSAGSKNYNDAADYVAGQFAAWGYQVEKQPFPVQYFEPQRVQATVVEPADSGITLNPNAMILSGSGNVTATLVYGGLGRPEDWGTTDLKGKIALLKRGEITFLSKAQTALERGAVGVLIYNTENTAITGSLAQPISVPVLSIGLHAGEALEKLLQSGPVQMHIDAQTVSEQRTTYNVIATKPGRSGQSIVVGAHLDSVPAGAGANDNASGTATMMEVARAMAGETYANTVIFIAFGGEELGLLGSRYYVQQLSPEARKAMIAMINLDMVGIDVTGLGIGAAGSGNRQAIAAQMHELAGELGIKAHTFVAGGASDHASFAEVDIPIAFLHTGIDENYHTASDRVTFIQKETLEKAGRLTLEAARRLARSGSLE